MALGGVGLYNPDIMVKDILRELEDIIAKRQNTFVVRRDVTGEVISYKTNKMPKLKLKTGSVEREIDVTISSIESEDEKLPHILLKHIEKQE
jgi:hypothetical protein